MVYRETAMKRVLTVAGHDLSNGAGITKDLEVFSCLGLHGISIPTSFVVQGPKGVEDVVPVGMPVFSQMLKRAAEDMDVSGVKIGVLADAPYVNEITGWLKGLSGIPVVLDPVIEAKNGTRLLTDAGLKAVVEQLFPLITCLTPNIDEAERLLGTTIDSVEAMERAARAIGERGPGTVVLKGGHLEGEPVDVLFDGRNVTTYAKKRAEKTVHGTGCMFSSSLLSFLVLGYPVAEAFRETQGLMEQLISRSYQPSANGYFYAFPAAITGRATERRRG
ncbi:MAG: Hydroxymethylpyrimidine/phosphomethylpyrimidine kinase [Syntrophorhabdaceae bacterium PtaU1.Bin034]|nr:MAG: Hydroxymethylpyrimidine/phosphomethylpyrimidine kinase [Syntrophorhabdaceae bacterium PtaU1.Bin034]